MHELKIPVKVRLGRQGVFAYPNQSPKIGKCVEITAREDGNSYTFQLAKGGHNVVYESDVIGEIEGQATLDLGPKLRPEPDFRWIDK